MAVTMTTSSSDFRAPCPSVGFWRIRRASIRSSCATSSTISGSRPNAADLSGLSGVQYSFCPRGEPHLKDDPYFATADWRQARILPPPQRWGGGLPEGRLPPVPLQIDSSTGKPHMWPIRNAIVHWATLLTIERPGEYDLRCRTIDANGIAQPTPRPFAKSGNNAIQQVTITAVTP